MNVLDRARRALARIGHGEAELTVLSVDSYDGWGPALVAFNDVHTAEQIRIHVFGGPQTTQMLHNALQETVENRRAATGGLWADVVAQGHMADELVAELVGIFELRRRIADRDPMLTLPRIDLTGHGNGAAVLQQALADPRLADWQHLFSTDQPEQPAAAAWRQLVGPIADKLGWRNGRCVLLTEGASRSELVELRDQFAALRTTFESIGEVEQHTQLLAYLDTEVDATPVAIYSDDRWDGSGPFEGINGEVDSEGILSILLAPTDNTPPSDVMFDELWQAVGHHVRAIQPMWLPGDFDYQIFLGGIESGRSPEAAAAATELGGNAARYGFTAVTVTGAVSADTGAATGSVVVTLTQPPAANPPEPHTSPMGDRASSPTQPLGQEPSDGGSSRDEPSAEAAPQPGQPPGPEVVGSQARAVARVEEFRWLYALDMALAGVREGVLDMAARLGLASQRQDPESLAQALRELRAAQPGEIEPARAEQIRVLTEALQEYRGCMKYRVARTRCTVNECWPNWTSKVFGWSATYTRPSMAWILSGCRIHPRSDRRGGIPAAHCPGEDHSSRRWPELALDPDCAAARSADPQYRRARGGGDCGGGHRQSGDPPADPGRRLCRGAGVRVGGRVGFAATGIR